MTNHEILYDCVTIFDSYKVRKWNMRKELKVIKAETQPFQTCVFNMDVCRWRDCGMGFLFGK